jgi:hypothetical protein
MKITARICILGVLSLLPLTASSASVDLTNAQFVHRGVGAFIGEITGVQVRSSDQYSESGTVQLKIVSIITGTISRPTITLSYTRALQATDDATNWDNIAPLYVSLGKVGIGRSVLIYFTEDNGSYLLAPAGNSVQDATTGFLLGKITKGDQQQSDKDHDCQQVQVEIIEVIYGSAGGSSTISLCLNARSFEHGKFATLGDGVKAWPLIAGSAPSSNSADPDCPLELGDQKLFISFDKSRISGVQVATSQLLTQLQKVDTE